SPKRCSMRSRKWKRSSSARRSGGRDGLRTGDGGGSGAVGCAGREIFGELGVPGAGRFGDCTLSGHPLLDRPAAIVTLVRFHWPPLGARGLLRKTIAPHSLKES